MKKMLLIKSKNVPKYVKSIKSDSALHDIQHESKSETHSH